MSHKDTSFSLGGRSHGGGIHHNGDYDYHEGYVVTPNGLVGVYAQGGPADRKYSRLDIAINGRQYLRTFDKRLTPRGLVTAASRFASEIVNGAAR